jgi:16S rRNA (cytosine967-C5)-methyltransferase
VTGPSQPRGPRGASGGPAKTRNVARRDIDPPRQVAWRVLRAVSAQDAYANLILPRLLRQAGLSGRDAAFATELTYGALRGRGTYDAVLAACVDRPLDRVDPELLDALRLGAHQLLAMRVPAHAAVAATVDLVRVEVGQGAAGFANAVLRKVADLGLDAWVGRLAPPLTDDPDHHLALAHAHPVWVVRALRDALRFAGRDEAELPPLLAADNERPTVTLAALPGLADQADLLAAGAVRAGDLSPLAAVAVGAPDDLPQVRQGRVRVQDEGSQLVALALAQAPLLGPDTGRWADLCAGPGGKAAILAATLLVRRTAGELPAQARLVATGLAPHRVDLVRVSVGGVVAAAGSATPQVVELRQGDAREVAQEDEGSADRVLVDAPCTGLGALRRRPEARWRRQPSDLAGLGPLQRELLRAALRIVRPGGVVAYVTCSPHPAETRLVVDDVLRAVAGVERLDARVVVTQVSGRPLDLGPGPDVQLWPHVHGCDAMFLSLLRRPTPARRAAR